MISFERRAARGGAAGSEGDSLLAQLRARSIAALFVVDGRAAILHRWLPRRDRWHAALVDDDPTPHFSGPILAAVRAQLERLEDGAAQPGFGFVPPDIVVRTLPLESWSGGALYAVIVEQLAVRQSIASAARKFALSRREREVLSLLVAGHGTSEIASDLHIALSTANDHVKRMLAKTQTRNRAELVARALGWDTSDEAAPPRP